MKHMHEKTLAPGAGSTLTKLREWFETDNGRVFADIECELARRSSVLRESMSRRAMI